MAITQAMCNSFKKELLEGVHNFKNSGGDDFKLALFAEGTGAKSSTTATLGFGTTALVTTGEVTSSGSYSTGGASLTRVDPSVATATTTQTAFTDFADLSFTTASITAMGALIYNSSDSNKAVCVLDFSTNKTSTSGTFTIQFPTADANNAIIRIA